MNNSGPLKFEPQLEQPVFESATALCRCCQCDPFVLRRVPQLDVQFFSHDGVVLGRNLLAAYLDPVGPERVDAHRYVLARLGIHQVRGRQHVPIPIRKGHHAARGQLGIAVIGLQPEGFLTARPVHELRLASIIGARLDLGQTIIAPRLAVDVQIAEHRQEQNFYVEASLAAILQLRTVSYQVDVVMPDGFAIEQHREAPLTIGRIRGLYG